MKFLYNAIITVFLLLLTVLLCRNSIHIRTDDMIEKICFEIEQDGNFETIKTWKNDKNECFVFLPSYANLENVHIRLKKMDRSTKLYLNGEPIKDGETLKNIETDKKYTLSGNGNIYPIQFLQSANVASMYVNTQSGTMKRLYADKKNKEEVTISLYTSDGVLDYRGGTDSIKCRGNGAFSMDKKPFTLILSEPNSLLNMSSASKWVLQSNTVDATNLRNKLAFDLAKNTGLQWTPDSQYFDLYLNGEYNGLYLLCEKIEVDENRLNIKDGEGFLCKNESIYRIDILENSFITENGRATGIIFPEKADGKQKETIEKDVKIMEKEILSKEDDFPTHIDLDSWVDKYLIDEITENGDADTASSYFYCVYKNDEPYFYAGPIWDYDQTMGSYLRNSNPKTFICNNEFKSRKHAILYYHALYQKDAFLQKVKEHYKNEMLPKLTELIDNGIENQANLIKRAAELNGFRWNIADEDMSYREIRDYLQNRIDFLNEAWIDDEDYCTIQIEEYKDMYFSSFSVKKGETFAKLIDSGEFNPDNNTLIDFYTGEKPDYNEPIFEDKIYVYESEKNMSDAAALYSKLVSCLEIMVLISFIIILIFIAYQNIKNQQKGGRE